MKNALYAAGCCKAVATLMFALFPILALAADYSGGAALFC